MVSDANLDLLLMDGWRIAVIPFIENPFIEPEDPKHVNFEERHEIGRRKTVLCKLHIWNLVEYDTIFYLDTDIIVVPGLPIAQDGDCEDEPRVKIDTIFQCGKKNGTEPHPNSKIGQFCAFQYSYDWSPSPSWFFNAGVLLVKPSREIFRDILVHARWLGTNRNFGDQGTLQKYFFLTCVSEGKFLLGDLDKQEEVSKLVCKFPDNDFLNYNSHYKVDAFKKLCASIGTEVSTEEFMLLPLLFHTSGPKANLYTGQQMDEKRLFRRTHMWTGESLGENIDKVYESLESGCMQLDRPWQDWASDDMHGDDRCESAVIHYLDADRKPWHWRLWPLAGYYSEWRTVSDMVPFAWRDAYFQIIVWGSFPILFLLVWSFFLNTWFCGIRNIEFESWRVFFYLGSCIRSVEFPIIGYFCRFIYHPRMPIIFKLPFYLIPNPFDPLLANWERFSLFVLMPCSILGTVLSFQIVPNQLPPLTGWLIYAEWSAFICCSIVILWAFLVYRVAHRGQSRCLISLNRLFNEPMDKQTKAILIEGVKLFLLQASLEMVLLAGLMYYGRYKEIDWWDLRDMKEEFFKARVALSWPIFVRGGSIFLKRFVYEANTTSKEIC
eukprot:TRINITY_DN5696_c0_g1_i4.p1 TRINITY_DN5696_c0_g1~~TRINITY_DN5696_c0_g1_i4.p1  ORF type:complete len:606 (-),score=81.82 TRINITY_DN5696_c0_g1_i4:42-1859(-)